MSEKQESPMHPFEVRISIGGDDWDYVLRTINDLAQHLREHGPECSLLSGGADGCHSVTVMRRDVSIEDFHRELHQWRGGNRPATISEESVKSADDRVPA